jgi:hypothetical protein
MDNTLQLSSVEAISAQLPEQFLFADIFSQHSSAGYNAAINQENLSLLF